MKKPPTEAVSVLWLGRVVYYLSAVETVVNVAFNWVPILLTAATITIERPAAISAYSMAVAPDSTLQKRHKLKHWSGPSPG